MWYSCHKLANVSASDYKGTAWLSIQNTLRLSNLGTDGDSAESTSLKEKGGHGWRFDRRSLKLSVLERAKWRKFRIIAVTSWTTPNRSTMSLCFGYCDSLQRFPLTLFVIFYYGVRTGVDRVDMEFMAVCSRAREACSQTSIHRISR